MPAMLDDPDRPVIYCTSSAASYPDPNDAHLSMPLGILPRQVTLRDRITIATWVPFSSLDQAPLTLLGYLSDQFTKEIAKGDTYPMIDQMPFHQLRPYWFANFSAVLLSG